MALEFTGPLAVAMFSSRRAIDFVWILMVIVGLAFLLPFRNNINSLDPVGVTIEPLFDLSILPIALAVAILSTAFPYTLEMFALTRMPAKTFGTLMNLEPVMGAFMGMIFLNEHLTLTQWFALFCIIGASIGSASTMKTKNETVEIN